MASTQSASSPRLVGCAIVFRHGARAITTSCVNHLLHIKSVSGGGDEKEEKEKNPSFHAASEWDLHEREDITSVGEYQMSALGHWFGKVYIKSHPHLHQAVCRRGWESTQAPTTPTPIGTEGGEPAPSSSSSLSASSQSSQLPVLKWSSSSYPRAIASGAKFVAAVSDGLGEETLQQPNTSALVVMEGSNNTSTSTSTSSNSSRSVLPSTPHLYLPETNAEGEIIRLTAPYAFGQHPHRPSTDSLLAAIRRGNILEKAAFRVKDRLESLYKAVTGENERGIASDAAAAEAEAVATTTTPTASDEKNKVEDEVGGNDNDDASASNITPTTTITHGHTIDPSEDAEDRKLAEMLWCLYYVQELYDCECHWPATAAAISNERPSFNLHNTPSTNTTTTTDHNNSDTNTKYPTGSSIAVIPGVKNALLRRLTPADESFLRHGSVWIWGQRYFHYPGAKSVFEPCGAEFLREILSDLTNAASGRGSPVSMYSGHDHTLYALLSGLRVKPEPKRTMSFAAYMLFEVWDHEALPAASSASSGSGGAGAGAIPSRSSSSLTLTVRLNSDPFPRAREGRPKDFEPGKATILFEDVSLQGLFQHLSRVPSNPARPYQ